MPRYSNVRKFRKRPSLNVGVCIFAVIFIYMVISVIIYAASKKTVVYEVEEGSLAAEDTYEGFIVRDETVVTSEYSGSVNYFLKSRHRAGLDTVICSVDETGRVYNMINEEREKNLSDEALTEIRSRLTELTVEYDNDKFYNTYSYSDTISNSIFEFQADNIVDNLDDYVRDTQDDGFFHKIKTTETGIVVYSVDGYEDFTEQELGPEIFDSSNYTVNNLQATSIINQGDPVYKLLGDDTWYIYIELNETEAASFDETNTVNIRFTGEDIKCSAGFQLVSVGDNYYGKISLNKYMINFADKRYVQIEITQNGTSGLKIPNSAIFTSNAYAIPKEYMYANGSMVMETYDEHGQLSYVSVTPTIYFADDEKYYISLSDFEIGDILVMPDSDEIFIVGNMEELSGVYCVNRGYAVFRAVEVLDKNEEYSIVRKGREYSLSKYDHIVLDDTTGNADEIVD